MKILRTSMFRSHAEPPFTLVVREADLAVPIEECANAPNPLRGAFTAQEIFEMPGEPSLVEATVEAHRRQQARALVESNMALLYEWDGAALAKVTKGGVLMGTLPAPLTVEEISTVFIQLLAHPNYDGHRIVAIAKTGEVVTLTPDGEVHGGSHA